MPQLKVQLTKSQGRYKVTLHGGAKVKYLGMFDSPELAYAFLGKTYGKRFVPRPITGSGSVRNPKKRKIQTAWERGQLVTSASQYPMYLYSRTGPFGKEWKVSDHTPNQQGLLSKAAALAPFKRKQNMSQGITVGTGRARVFHPIRSAPDYDPSYLQDDEGKRARSLKAQTKRKAKKAKVRKVVKKTTKRKPATKRRKNTARKPLSKAAFLKRMAAGRAKAARARR